MKKSLKKFNHFYFLFADIELFNFIIQYFIIKYSVKNFSCDKKCKIHDIFGLLIKH